MRLNWPVWRAGSRAVPCAPLRGVATFITFRLAETASSPGWCSRMLPATGKRSVPPPVRLRDALRQHVDHWDQSTLIRQLNDSFLKGAQGAQFATAFARQLLFRYRRAAVYQRRTCASAVVSCGYRGVEPLVRFNAPQQRDCRPSAGPDRGDLLSARRRCNWSRAICCCCTPTASARPPTNRATQLGLERLLSIARNLPTESAVAAGKGLSGGRGAVSRYGASGG